MNNILNIELLSKSYNHIQVLSDISITVEQGKIIGILGENGSGKSTLLKIIAGIIKPNIGTGNLLGLPLFQTDFVYRKYLVYWGHDPLFYPELTGKENIELFLSLRGQDNNKDLIYNNIINLKMEYHINRIVREYSFGQIQKLKLIQCSIAKWQLALFDEVTSGLDNNTILFLEKKIEEWNNEKRTIIITSHKDQWLRKLADTIFTIKKNNLFRVEKND